MREGEREREGGRRKNEKKREGRDAERGKKNKIQTVFHKKVSIYSVNNRTRISRIREGEREGVK